jgi:hypothetical protein
LRAGDLREEVRRGRRDEDRRGDLRAAVLREDALRFAGFRFAGFFFIDFAIVSSAHRPESKFPGFRRGRYGAMVNGVCRRKIGRKNR